VGSNGRDDGNRIEGLVLQHLVQMPRLAHGWVPPSNGGERFRTQVAHPGALGLGNLLEVSDEIRPPVPESDDPNAHRSR
jgi:hypothetical protein